MKHFVHSYSKKDYLFVLLCMAGYLLLVCQYYPISGDDFRYRFHYGDGSDITTVHDIVDSCWYGYLFHTGRFLAHCFIQYFMSFGGFVPFYIMSAVLFGVLFLSLLYLSRFGGEAVKGDRVVMLGLFFCLFPLPATSLWGTVAMTVNYLWSAAIYMSFLSVYLHVRCHHTEYYWKQNVLLFLFGFFCGSWQESFCIGIVAVLFVIHLFTIKKTKGSLLWLVMGFGLGAAFLIFAPGNFVRTDEATNILSGDILLWQIRHVFFGHFYVLSWLYIGLLSVIVDFRLWKEIRFLRNNGFLFLIGLMVTLFSVLMAVVDVYQGDWQSTVQAIIGVVLLARLISFYCGGWIEKHYRLVGYAIVVVALAVYIPVYHYRNVLKQATVAWEREICTSTDNNYYDGEARDVVMNRIPQSPWLFDMICPMYHTWDYDYLLPKMNRFWKLGREEMEEAFFMPEPTAMILHQCVEDNRIGDGVYKSNKPYIIIREAVNNSNGKVIVNIYPTEPLKRLWFRIRKKAGRQRVADLDGLRFIEENGKRYYILKLDYKQYNRSTVLSASIK